MPGVTVYRTREVVNITSDYVVYIDAKKKGVLRRGKKIHIDLKPGEYILTASMDDYGSRPFKLKVGHHDVKLKLTSFRFNNFLLPLMVTVILGFSYVHQTYGVSWYLGILCISPLLAVAVYFHFIRKDRYLVFRIAGRVHQR